MASGILGKLTNAIQGSYAQVDPFDSNRTYATNEAAANKYDDGGGFSVPNSSSSTSGAPGYDYQGAINAANQSAAAAAQYAQAVQAQIAAQPKIISYNGTYQEAQQQVQGAVDAVYADKLNQYLQQENLGKAQQTRQESEKEADIAGTLTNQTADNATTRTRTGEDQATKIGDTNLNETNYQADSGTAFDKARTALLGSVANSGLTTSGIGQGQVASSTAQRNQGDQEQTQQFNAQRRDINTSASRTFEDLATSDTRNTQAAATGTTRSKEALQDYIDNANLSEQGFRQDNETDRQGALLTATTDQYQQNVRNFIASLVGSGARAQDIAATAQVYG